MEPTQAKLTAWIMRDCMNDQGFGEGGGGFRLLVKDPITSKHELVGEFRVIGPETNPQDIAASVYLSATEEAEGMGNGTHHFVLFAHRDGQKEHFAKRAFLVLVDNQDSVLSEDEANAKGLLGQTQRHLEAVARINAQMLPSVGHAYQSVLHLATERLAQHERNHLEMMGLMKELFERKEERDLEIAAKVAREQRINMILDRVAEFAPVLLPKLLPGLLGDSSPPAAPSTPPATPPKDGGNA